MRNVSYTHFLSDDIIIGKINGIVSSLYMLDIIDEPIIISNYFEANKLKKSIEEYLIRDKGDKNHERK